MCVPSLSVVVSTVYDHAVVPLRLAHAPLSVRRCKLATPLVASLDVPLKVTLPVYQALAVGDAAKIEAGIVLSTSNASDVVV